MSPTSRISGQDTLWAIDASGDVYKNVFTTSGSTVVYGSWSAVDRVPGGGFYGQALAVGVNSTPSQVEFALGVTTPFSGKTCTTNANCGTSEECSAGFCTCAPDTQALYQLNSSGHWVGVWGTTSAEFGVSTSGVNECVYAIGMDDSLVIST